MATAKQRAAARSNVKKAQAGARGKQTLKNLPSQTRTALDYLGDLAIVVMFSVFESLVRDRVLTHFEAATSGTIDPVLRRALDATRDGLAEGSFYRILEAHKERGNVERNDLIEEVNQVRKYRNWVAHGRRGSQPDLVTPQAAYDRLQAFLAALGLV